MLEYLVNCGWEPPASEMDRAIGDLALIAFYYLLYEYTIKGKWEETKQTIQLKMEDITFLLQQRVGTAAVSPLPCAGQRHSDGEWSDNEVGQPKEWMEGGVRLPREQWRTVALLSAGIRALISTLTAV